MKDKLDQLKLIDLKEDPSLVEDCMILEQHRAESEEDARAILNAIFLQADRQGDFERFYESRDFNATLNILRLFSLSQSAKILEIGGGPGFLGWALKRSGFTNLDMLEPNNYWNTGTAYLRSRPDARSIRIFRDTQDWHSVSEPYDAFITKNCIHHFQNLTMAAATLRQKLKPGGFWFAFREWFADTAEEVAELVRTHPYCQKYGLYEWPYPAAHYVESFALAGLKLWAIVPAGYRNDCLGTYSENMPESEQTKDDELDKLLEVEPEKTVQQFWKEVAAIRSGDFSTRLYTHPQLMVFKRFEV
ncbi:MAG TPA: methyltransferase domain-containing protein [Oculatellaceae cyanobacterium]